MIKLIVTNTLGENAPELVKECIIFPKFETTPSKTSSTSSSNKFIIAG